MSKNSLRLEKLEREEKLFFVLSCDWGDFLGVLFAMK